MVGRKQIIVEISGIRWYIAFLLFLSTVICYIDRLTISVLAPVLKADLGLSNLQYAGISTWFLISYSVFQTIFGHYYDRIGTKKGFAIAISIWSFSSMMHALAKGIAGLSIWRTFLGIGESGNWPGNIKAISEWFPARERALGLSIVNCGAALGSVVAPPLIIWIQLKWGWQAAFLSTGALGFIWLILWLLFYQSPDRHKLITKKEYEHIHSGDPEFKKEPSIGVPSWRSLLRYPQLWGIVLARFFGDPIWWLYLIWLPSYLFDVRGFNMKEIGSFAWIPFLASGIGSLSGGWFSGFLISKGESVNRARKIAILIPTLIMPLGLVVISAKTVSVVLFCMSLVLFGFQFWVNNVQTLPSDYFPKHYVASVAGLSQTGAGIGAILFTMGIGWIVDHFSYTPVLVIAGMLGPAATISLFVLGGRIHRLDIN